MRIAPPEQINIVLLIESAALRQKINQVIGAEKDLRCLLSVNSLGDLFECVDSRQPIDLVITDLVRDSPEGLLHFEKLSRLLPASRFLILDGLQRLDVIIAAVMTGINGYLTASFDLSVLPYAIRVVATGGSMLDPDMLALVLNEMRTKQRDLFKIIFGLVQDHLQVPENWELNQREQQILIGLMDGKTYKEIGSENNIGLNTVRVYVKSLYRKLQVHDRHALVKLWNDQKNTADVLR